MVKLIVKSVALGVDKTVVAMLLLICGFLLALVRADQFTMCDLHPWRPECGLDEFDSYPAVKLDHNISRDTQVQPTEVPLPKLDTLGPPPKVSEG